jgi:hypothetical protein
VSDLLALVLVGVAAAAAIVLVATPLLRAGSREERLDAIGEGQRRRLALREERDDALAALRELEFDHRTGKIADEDYRPLVAQYRRRVAAALEALDRPAGAGRGRPAGRRAAAEVAAARQGRPRSRGPCCVGDPPAAAGVAEPVADADVSAEPAREGSPPSSEPTPNATADDTTRYRPLPAGVGPAETGDSPRPSGR